MLRLKLSTKMLYIVLFFIPMPLWAIEYTVLRVDNEVTDQHVEQVILELQKAEEVFSKVTMPNSLELKISLVDSSMSHVNHRRRLEIPLYYKFDENEPPFGWSLTRAGVVHELGHAIFDETVLRSFDDFEYHFTQKQYADSKKEELLNKIGISLGPEASIWDAEKSEDPLVRSLFYDLRAEQKITERSFFEIPEARAIGELFADLVSVLVYSDLSIMAKLSGGKRSFERDFNFNHPLTSDPFYRIYTYYNPARSYVGKSLAKNIKTMNAEEKSKFLKSFAVATIEELRSLRSDFFGQGAQFSRNENGDFFGFHQDLGLTQKQVNIRFIQKLKAQGI